MIIQTPPMTMLPIAGRSTWILLVFVLFQGQVIADGEEVACGGKPAEIVFVLDSSSSIYPEDYDKQIEFVRDVVDIFDIGPDKMRVGAIAFSDDVEPQFDLGSNTNKSSLIAAVNKIKNYGGGTHTGKALKYLRKVSLSKDNVRPGVPKIGIVLTDGLSNDPVHTKMEAYLAREEGIIMFVVGIGWGVDGSELAAIGSEPKENFILQIDDFLSLATIKDKLAIKACKAEEQLKPTEPSVKETNAVIKEACGGKPADVVFALDTSTSIFLSDYQKQLRFVKDVVEMFDLGQEKTRVGLFTFSDDAYPQFSLTTFNSKPDLLDAIIQVAYTGGNTFTDIALNFMRETAFKPSYERPEAVRIGILLTDGLSHNTRKTLEEAAKTRKFVNLFVIGIGPDADPEELDGIASSPIEEYRFTSDDFDALQSIKNKLAIQACAVETKQVMMSDHPSVEECLNIEPTDLVLAVDSARFGQYATSLIHDFINNLMISFNVGSEATRVSMLTTSCSKQGNISLSAHFSRTGFQHELMNVESSEYDTLLKTVRISGFSKENGARQTAAKMALLFLTGTPREDEVKRFSRQLKRAKFQGIKVLLVSIGGRIEKKDLIDLFGENFGNFFISADDVSQLTGIREHLLQMLCPGLGFDLGPFRAFRGLGGR